MGNSKSQNKAKVQILNYYLFQKKIKNFLNKSILEDNTKIEIGYIINNNYVKHWKKIRNYDFLSGFLDDLKIESTKLDDNQIKIFNEFIKKNKINYYNNVQFKEANKLLLDIFKRILSIKDLNNFVNEPTFNELKTNQPILFEKIEYIFKKQMIIFFLEKYKAIKFVIHSFNQNKELINLAINYSHINTFNSFHGFFEKKNSEEIVNYLLNINVFDKPYIIQSGKNNDDLIFLAYNIEKHIYSKIQSKKSNNNNANKSNSEKDEEVEIKYPHQINFELLKELSFRGLDNVGATCYMNATLQCLANIEPITNYLLNPNIYSFLHSNFEICLLTLEYIQVLIGLFCNESRNGSYSPNYFKNTISEMNPLFKGVKANDSKDLIIFLLEIMNKELVNIYNKKHKIVENKNNFIQQIDISDEYMILNNFLNEFKKSHCSIIGDNLCGFQKSVFICQSCCGKAINFNVFNFLIFSLEATSNYFNLSNNNQIIPNINFDNCFQFLSKKENFQETYCQKCGKTGNSIYQEVIYSMPNYLIIILNRGKGNIFNCNVNIEETFYPSIYVEKEKNIEFKLIGIVTHFGESGMGGHFIAFCKHFKDGKWRCYNDSIVTECKSDYLQKGIPYILFYQKNIINNNQNIPQMNNNQYNNGLYYNNQQMNIFNNGFQQNNFQQNMNNNFSQKNNNFQQNMAINNNNLQYNINNNNLQQNKNINNINSNNINYNNFQGNINNIINNNLNQNMNFNDNQYNNYQQNLNNNNSNNNNYQNNYMNYQQNIYMNYNLFQQNNGNNKA